MNRRGFLTGLGALLATSALVKPALPSDELTFSIVSDGGYSYSDDGTYFPARCYEGTIGRYLGISFINPIDADDLRYGISIRCGRERIPPEQWLLPMSESQNWYDPIRE